MIILRLDHLDLREEGETSTMEVVGVVDLEVGLEEVGTGEAEGDRREGMEGMEEGTVEGRGGEGEEGSVRVEAQHRLEPYRWIRDT